ncbi:right-handed parallel beta-helix repeat-containing protein [Maribellus maritimus]|uniref:right-handed parallel beta-helix repeat-containing protein n=1 Tax=Maribellus maritimus TaxID=2870838 RepID=UPI001EEA4202|nr:right-handed parallel beta-helix repeat-containing protein [Maribellus maritimus]MCG6185922.1 right-handed parallel beta-helix repeat-containing protein [Maribellus maritimus]
MVRYLLQILLVVLLAVSFFACEDEKYLNSPDAQLQFSADTVAFDTIFTTIGSTTRRFTVYNPYEENVLISRIRLAGGDFSSFRLNINGIAANEAYEVEVPARDSIFVFVEVTIDPNGQNLPMVVEDSIEFTTNTNIQGINLVAYGQDFRLIKGETIETTTWNAEKPYLIYDYAYVDSTSTLTIEPGTKVYFHDGAGLYVKGTIVADGTVQNPIAFQADRLEDSYKNIPDQWSGIILFSGSHDNVFNFTTIKNANIGLQVGTIEDEGFASVHLSNSRIENMAYAGIFALKSKIYGYNDVIANCGYYAVALLIGGEYEFYNSTIANYWGNYSRKSRSTSSLVVSNVLKVSNSDGSSKLYLGDLNKATFGNSIIYGNNLNELELGKNEEKQFNFLFDHCIIQVPDTFNVSNKDHYKNVYRGDAFDPLFVDPYEDYDYSLDSLSPARDIGSVEIANMFPVDILDKDRFSDDAPDLGAFEFIKRKNED